MKARFLLVSLLMVFGLSISSIAYAQGGGPGFPTDNDVNEIAKKLYCPVCPNTPLDVCETKACQDWRAQIKDQLSSGWTEDQVIDYFVLQYGERVLAEPQRKGFSALVWILPSIVVASGLIALWYVIKGWRARRESVKVQNDNGQKLEPEVVARIEEKLNRIR